MSFMVEMSGMFLGIGWSNLFMNETSMNRGNNYQDF